MSVDIENYFRNNARTSCCTLTIRHRDTFDQGLEAVLVRHATSVVKWKTGSKPVLSPWKPGVMLYVSSRDIDHGHKAYDSRVYFHVILLVVTQSCLQAYGIPRNINPNAAFDSKGQILISPVEHDGEFVDMPCWPPPYYNVVLNIPPRAAERIRQTWPGENPVDKPKRQSFSLTMRRLSIFQKEAEEAQI